MSKIKNINYKCPKCENGVVVLVEKETKLFTNVTVKDCNGRGAFHGILSLAKLKPLSLKDSPLLKID